MAEKEVPELLDERVISNRGLIVWTPSPLYRRFWVNCQVIRFPKLNFLSKKINPDRSEYAQITFMREGVVLREERLNFEYQTFVWDTDIVGYLAKYLNCYLAGLNQGLIAIGAALGVIITEAEEIFCEPLQDQFDQIKFVVRVNAAIAVQLYGLRYDIGCGEAEPIDQSPPPPPEFPTYPSDTDLAETETPASPPYAEPNDSGDTIPLEGDAEPPPPPPPEPPGVACTKYRVTIRHGSTDPGGLATREIICYGEVGTPFIQPSGGARAVVLPCQGYAFPTLDEGCQGGIVDRTVFVSDSVLTSPAPVIIGFEVYTP